MLEAALTLQAKNNFFHHLTTKLTISFDNREIDHSNIFLSYYM